MARESVGLLNPDCLAACPSVNFMRLQVSSLLWVLPVACKPKDEENKYLVISYSGQNGLPRIAFLFDFQARRSRFCFRGWLWPARHWKALHADLDVCLVDPDRAAMGFAEGPQPALDQGRVGQHPAVQGAVVDLQAALEEQLLDVTVTQGIA